MSDTEKCCQSILVVEDDSDIREALIDVLESEGYHAVSATNGKEALDLLHEIQKPCLVLLDMMMPIMNGQEFLECVMKDSYLAPIPVLIVSAIADKTNTKGAIGIIKKPVDIDTVLKIVDEYCKGTFTEVQMPRDSSAQSHHP